MDVDDTESIPAEARAKSEPRALSLTYSRFCQSDRPVPAGMPRRIRL